MSGVIGYARVSTADQSLQLQIDALRAAGVTHIVEEKASGVLKGRPELSRMLRGLQRGDTVVVWKLDRAARSLPHLLDIIERIRFAGASFRCIAPPIDTASPTGTLTLQILGAVAEFERSLIIERTRAGLLVAREAGRVGGNPRLKSKDGDAVRLLSERRKQIFRDQVLQRMSDWQPVVKKYRPTYSWEDVVKWVNAKLPAGQKFTKRTLMRHVRTAVDEGLIDHKVLARQTGMRAFNNLDNDPAYSAVLISLRRAKRPTLQEIANDLHAAGIRTRRGAEIWPLSTVADLVKRVEKAANSK